MTDDNDANRQARLLRQALRQRADYMRSGAHEYRVRMRVSGTVTYLVRADSPSEAEDKAWDRYEDGDEPHTDSVECDGSVHVERVDDE